MNSSEDVMYDQAVNVSDLKSDLSLWRGRLTGPGVGRVVWVRADDEDHAASQIWSWWLEQPQIDSVNVLNVPSMPTVLLDVRRVA